MTLNTELKRILLVEDEMAIAEHLTKFLHKENFSIEHLNSGKEVVESVKNSPPALIVLDIMLPHKDGITCCKEIRQFSDVPIIMLTAKVEEIERIIGLKAGADDYVCKPFSAEELTLRISGILRRLNIENETRSLTLNTDNYTIKYRQKINELTHVEFLLFNLLYNKPGRIYSREQIIELAYPITTEANNRAIDCHIKNIRKKLKTIGLEANVIESIYGAGYKFVPPE